MIGIKSEKLVPIKFLVKLTTNSSEHFNYLHEWYDGG
jgi:hypothetical protein